MKNVFVVALLLWSCLNSGGVALVRYVCEDTGARGLALGVDLACHAAGCAAASQSDSCCPEDVCCDFEAGPTSPAESLAGVIVAEREDHDVSSTVVVTVATTDVDDPLPTTLGTTDARPCHDAPAFAGFERPLRI